MNVPKPLRFEVDTETILKILNVLCTIYTRLFTYPSYTETRTVMIPQPSLRKRLVNWQGDREVVFSR